MKTKKTPFFVRLKKAIFNFDEYMTFLEEKISIAIKYILKLTLIFTIIVTVALMWKAVSEVNSEIENFNTEIVDFNFKENTLIIEGENQRIIKGDENGYFGIIVDSQNDNLSDIEDANNYQRLISILKDKIIIRDADGIENSITYEELSENYDLSNINKNTILQFLSRR